MGFLLFAAGLAATVKGADWVTDGAIWAARRLSVPEVVIGATLLSVATTLPELSVSVLAATSGHPTLALGNAVGSCIANMGLIMGLSVAISGVLSPKARPFTAKIALATVTSLLVLALARDGGLSRDDGVIMLLGFGAYVVYIGRNLVPSQGQKPAGPHCSQILAMIAGALLLAAGSRLTVSGGVLVARVLGVPEAVVGLTMVSVGTSVPELTASVTSALKGHFALSVGNVVGANMINLTLVLGLSAILAPMRLGAGFTRLDAPALVYFGLALLVLAWTSSKRERWKGLSLLLSYGSYLWVLLGR